jgi:hypothetical protein
MIQEKFENSFIATYLSPGIVQFEILDMAEIDIREAQAMHAFSLRHTKGRNYVTFFKAGPMLNVTREAREFGTNVLPHSGLVAQAILAQSLAHRILGNFMVRFNPGMAEIKLFSNEQSAMLWLERKLSQIRNKQSFVQLAEH